MKLELDLNWLKSVKLTPNNYAYLMCKFKEVKYPFSMSLYDARELEKAGYIKLTRNSKGKIVTVLRQQFIDLVEGDFDKMFAELCATYPHKVGTPNNYRVLHPRDPDAVGNKAARARYKKVVNGKPQKHAIIIKALDNQLKAQRNKLEFFNLLEVWINKAVWDSWIDFKEDVDENRNTKVLD